ncbi:MAG TPA: nucleotidyltransferase family protein [bacterium]|nr:nucleotidyltransferase family protein [bacterium]
MKAANFPEIKFRKEFSDFAMDPYFLMTEFVKSKDPELKSLYLNNEASNLLKYKVFKEFCGVLEKEGFKKFIPVKGSYLFNTIFEDFQGLRQMADIDMLIHTSEFSRVPEFIRKYPEMKMKSSFPLKLRRYFGEDFSFIYKNVLIELHSNISLIPFSGFMDEVFGTVSAIETNDHLKIAVPDIEYELMLMLIHDYSRDDFADLKLKRVLEFYIVLYNCDMGKVKNIAKLYGLEKMLDCHMFMIYTMLETPFYGRDAFTIDESFGYIDKSDDPRGFTVRNAMKLQKVLYGRRWYLLKARNLTAAVFKSIFLRK